MSETVRLIYGHDPLCGWCWGFAPALAALRAARPALGVDLVLAGLVTGARVGPYAAMKGYIQGASGRLAAVTGRRPSPAFFDLIGRADVISDSAPPSAVLAAARAVAPEAVLDLADAIQDAHFDAGHALGDPETYAPILARLGLPAGLADILHDPARVRTLAEGEFARGRALGIASFPTLILATPNGLRPVDLAYDAPGLIAAVDRAGG